MKTIYEKSRPLVLLLILAAALMLLAGCGGGEKTTEPIPAATNEERMAYLSALGWQVDPEPLHTLVLRLPGELAADYADYVKLQEEQDLPFAQCAGKTISRYTYTVRNYPDCEGPVQINLCVCDGVLVGGDLIAPGEDGFMAGLAFPKT